MLRVVPVMVLLVVPFLVAGPSRGVAEEVAQPVPLTQVEPPRARPDLTLPVLDGAGLSLSELAKPITVVHFFATWCEPCRRELPALQRFAGRMAEEGVRVVLVDVAEAEARVRRFFSEVPAPGPILMDRDRAAARAWDVSILPSTFVLGPDLAVRLSAAGEVAWDDPATDAAVRALADAAAPAAVRQVTAPNHNPPSKETGQ